MGTATIEERLRRIEQQLAELAAEKKVSEMPWHERWKGAFKDDETFDRAMEAGAEYRRSQPTAAEEIEALERAGVHVSLPDGH
jgi:succinyl-CoA synthetase alpha subunit